LSEEIAMPSAAVQRSRRRSPLDGEDEQALFNYVSETRPTTEEVIDWVADQFGIRYSPTGLRTVLYRIGCYMPHGHLRGSHRAQQWAAR
jgi:transposase